MDRMHGTPNSEEGVGYRMGKTTWHINSGIIRKQYDQTRRAGVNRGWDHQLISAVSHSSRSRDGGRWLQASEILDSHFTPSGKNDSVPPPQASEKVNKVQIKMYSFVLIVMCTDNNLEWGIK